MFKLRIKRTFDAAHYLPLHKGKCKQLHGHTWTVEAFVITRELNEEDMVVDFAMLKEFLDEVLSEFDHSCLNDSLFVRAQPTAENLCQTIYVKLSDKLEKKFDRKKLLLKSVRVWESEDSYAEFESERNL